LKHLTAFNYLLGIILLLLLAGFAAPKLKTLNVTKEISVALPQDFIIMPDDAIATEYPSPRKPLAAYTSANGQIDFILTERPSMFRAEDLQMVQQFYKASINNKYSEVKFIRDEVKTIKKQDYVIFEFTSMVRDEERKNSRIAPIRKYTIVQYAIYKNKLLIFTLNVPIDLREGWQDTAHKIMQSIKLS